MSDFGKFRYEKKQRNFRITDGKTKHNQKKSEKNTTKSSTADMSDFSEIPLRKKTAEFPENRRENQQKKTEPQRRAAQLTCRTFQKFCYAKKSAEFPKCLTCQLCCCQIGVPLFPKLNVMDVVLWLGEEGIWGSSVKFGRAHCDSNHIG